jgi:hypothetical protein
MRIGTNIPQFQNEIQSAYDEMERNIEQMFGKLIQDVSQRKDELLDQIQNIDSSVNQARFTEMLQSGQMDLNSDTRLQGLIRNPGLIKNPVYRKYVEAGLFDPLTMPEKLLQKVSDSINKLMPPPNPIFRADSTSVQSHLSEADQRAIIIIGGNPGTDSQYQALQEMQSAVQQNVGLREQINASTHKGIIFR